MCGAEPVGRLPARELHFCCNPSLTSPTSSLLNNPTSSSLNSCLTAMSVPRELTFSRLIVKLQPSLLPRNGSRAVQPQRIHHQPEASAPAIDTSDWMQQTAGCKIQLGRQGRWISNLSSARSHAGSAVPDGNGQGAGKTAILW